MLDFLPTDNNEIFLVFRLFKLINAIKQMIIDLKYVLSGSIQILIQIN